MCDYNISFDKMGRSKHNKTLLRHKESKDRQHVSALFYKAIIRSSLVLHVRPDGLIEKRAETCCLSFDSLYVNKVLLCFDLPTLSIEILYGEFPPVCCISELLRNNLHGRIRNMRGKIGVCDSIVEIAIGASL